MTSVQTTSSYGYSDAFPCFVERDSTDKPYSFFVTLYHPLDVNIATEKPPVIHAAVGIGLNSEGWSRLGLSKNNVDGIADPQTGISLDWIRREGLDRAYKGEYDVFSLDKGLPAHIESEKKLVYSHAEQPQDWTPTKVPFDDREGVVAEIARGIVAQQSRKRQSLKFSADGQTVTLRASRLVPGRPEEIRELVLTRSDGPTAFSL